METKFFEQEVVDNILKSTVLLNIIKSEIIEKNKQFSVMSKNGVNFGNQCPFCQSKGPSFQIDNNKYYCYSCGRGGNAIDFIMRYKNLAFIDAVQYLATKCNISTELPPFTQKVISRKNSALLKINQTAAKFYFDQLRNEIGQSGIKYFNDRGVTPLIRSKFGLGYAGEFGDTLYQYLKSTGYSDNDILESGLVAKVTKNMYNRNNPNMEYYDKFYNRVMFPILSADSKVIGFGGRILGDGKPKYLNSQETQVFDKGKNLYGYNIAQNSKLPYYICCEGYMDAMSLHQYGYDCAVASLGTALTRDQIELLCTKDEILLAYDSDDAGIKAAKRAILLCREVGLKIRVLQMKGAKDPDEFLKKFGTEEFDKLIKNAETDKHFLIRNSKTEDGKFDFYNAVDELF